MVGDEKLRQLATDIEIDAFLSEIVGNNQKAAELYRTASDIYQFLAQISDENKGSNYGYLSEELSVLADTICYSSGINEVTELVSDNPFEDIDSILDTVKGAYNQFFGSKLTRSEKSELAQRSLGDIALGLDISEKLISFGNKNLADTGREIVVELEIYERVFSDYLAPIAELKLPGAFQ